MSGLLWRLARDQTIEALVLGTLAAQARQRQAALGPLPVSPHPIPDLTGESVEVVEVVVQAVLDAIVAAHSGEWATDGTCSALIDLASRFGDPTEKLWPDPVRRHLAEVLDAEMVRRAE